MGSLGILRAPGEPVATLDDAPGPADASAFDYDAPITVSPAWNSIFPDAVSKDPLASLPHNRLICPRSGEGWCQ
jgi:hypothetical protein